MSSDRDASQFKEYYDEQAAWAALPFKDRATKNALSKKYKVRGIPTLVILDGKTGETITLDGRDGVSSEPEAFPWKPPSVQDISWQHCRPSSTRRARRCRCPKDRGLSYCTSRRTGARPAAASRRNLLNFFRSSRRSIRTYRSSVRNTTR